jgi:hypothetical protein
MYSTCAHRQESLKINDGRSSAQNPADFDTSQYGGGHEPYLELGAERAIPLSKEEIEDTFHGSDLQQKFGFQRDSMRNIVRCDFDGHIISYSLLCFFSTL